MKSKCKVCKINEAIWAWQPFGPNESYDLFMFLGHHYRTFAIIKICDDCSEKVKRSLPPTSTPFRFEYDATRLVALNGEIVKDKPALAAPEPDDTPAYDPDCYACLKGRVHTISEHNHILSRNYAASVGD